MFNVFLFSHESTHEWVPNKSGQDKVFAKLVCFTCLWSLRDLSSGTRGKVLTEKCTATRRGLRLCHRVLTFLLVHMNLQEKSSETNCVKVELQVVDQVLQSERQFIGLTDAVQQGRKTGGT